MLNRIILALTFLVSILAAESLTQSDLRSELVRYYSNEFKASSGDIHISILHSFKTREYTGSYYLDISANNPILDVGYQTVWVEVRQKHLLVDRFLMSVRVGLNMDVPVARERIARHKSISSKKIEIRHKLMTNTILGIVNPTDDLTGLVTNRVIQAGRVIKRDYLQEQPLIWKESPVRVQIITDGGLVLETSGITKKDGALGDRIHVLCPTTGKRLTGIVKSPNLVVVPLQ